MTLHMNNREGHYKISSLTSECLRNLRQGNTTKGKIGHKNTHLLGFMSEFVEQKEEVKDQEVEELCCYDRMKKLIISKDDDKEERQGKEAFLGKAIQIEAKMNQMERSIKQKETNAQAKAARQLRKSKTQHQHSAKSQIINNLKEKGYEKFFKLQKIHKENDINKIKTIIGEEVESKFHKAVQEKDFAKRRLANENKLFERRILEKNVDLETLKSENAYLKSYIKELQQKLYGANNQLQNAHLIASYEKWLNDYKTYFGEMSIYELKQHMEEIKDKCLDKFDSIENKNSEKVKELSATFEKNQQSLKKNIEKLEHRQNELIEVNKNLKMNKKISEMEINQLLHSKEELKSLQKQILHLYNEWYAKRTENQKELMKTFNKFKENYSYQDMLQYIVFYDEKISTNDKLNDFILKVLRGIQKIRRMIFPMQSNEKIDPFAVLQKIEKWTNVRLREQEKIRNSKLNNGEPSKLATSSDDPFAKHYLHTERNSSELIEHA